MCVTAGLSLGMAVREKWFARKRLLEETQELLGRLRLLLTQERLGLCELLTECTQGAKGGMAQRFALAAELLRREPLLSLPEVYQTAEAQIRLPGEGPQERAALRQLFGELGIGTAAMREAAAASCLRRLKPAYEEADRRCRAGGKLCMQLGLLAGVMAGIILW